MQSIYVFPSSLVANPGTFLTMLCAPSHENDAQKRCFTRSIAVQWSLMIAGNDYSRSILHFRQT